MEPSLSFNTIISFMTNTNLQHYAGESGLSNASQMCVIIYMMFTSAATGYAACMAFCRGLAGRQIGNFYRDVVRIITRVLIPLSFLVGLFLVSQEHRRLWAEPYGTYNRRKIAGYRSWPGGSAGIH